MTPEETSFVTGHAVYCNCERCLTLDRSRRLHVDHCPCGICTRVQGTRVVLTYGEAQALQRYQAMMKRNWRVSVKGSTSYMLVQATSEQEAIALAAAELGERPENLECDPAL